MPINFDKFIDKKETPAKKNSKIDFSKFAITETGARQADAVAPQPNIKIPERNIITNLVNTAKDTAKKFLAPIFRLGVKMNEKSDRKKQDQLDETLKNPEKMRKELGVFYKNNPALANQDGYEIDLNKVSDESLKDLYSAAFKRTAESDKQLADDAAGSLLPVAGRLPGELSKAIKVSKIANVADTSEYVTKQSAKTSDLVLDLSKSVPENKIDFNKFVVKNTDQADGLIEEIAPVIEKQVKKNKTVKAQAVSENTKNSLMNNPAETKPNRLSGEGYSLSEAEIGSAKNGENLAKRIVIGKNENGDVILKDGRHLLEAYREKNIDIPRDKIKLEDGIKIKDIAPSPIEYKPIKEYGEIIPEIKTSKLGLGVEAKAIKSKLTDAFSDLPEYAKVDVAQQAEYSDRFVKDFTEEAIAIAKGNKTPPPGLLPESVFTAVENYAIKTRNVGLMESLAKSNLVTEATGMGQRLRMLAERMPDSPISKIRETIQNRIKYYEKRTGKSFSIESKKEISNIKKELKAVTPKADEWQKFLSEITC